MKYVYEDVQTEDGVRLWIARSGTGHVPVALCHGGPGSWDQLEPLAEMIDDLAEVVRWDQRGAGRSDPVGPYSIDRFVDDLDCVRQHCGHERWVVVGHSWGGALALHYAIRHHRRLRGLVYMSGTGIRWSHNKPSFHAERDRRLTLEQLDRVRDLKSLEHRDESQEREMWTLLLSADYANRSQSLGLARRWLDTRYKINYEANAAINAEARAREEELAEALARVVDAPALVIHGAQDARPVVVAEEVAGALPEAHLAVIDGMGHFPWAERPDQTRRLLRGFLAALKP